MHIPDHLAEPLPKDRALQRLKAELRRHLQERLPDYMIPTAFVVLEQIPLTPSGKIDRRALPAADIAQSELAGRFVPPQTPTEKSLAEIWRRVLGIERVGIESNFFELGGHSLLATQVNSQIRAVLQAEVPLRVLFESPTISKLAAWIDEHCVARPDAGMAAIEPTERAALDPGELSDDAVTALLERLLDEPRT
ncbi:MAG: hypothetical protein IPO81_16410 [Kouleothrix sp.]|nr:hypothetical protein [Kouleothrix sp.]